MQEPAELTTLRPVPMPRDAHSMMRLDPKLDAEVRAWLDVASGDGRWTYPTDIEINPRNPESLAYWLHKSSEPIVRGMRGCGVEEALEPFRLNKFQLNRADLKAEREVVLSAAGDLMCTPGLDGAENEFFAKVADVIFDADISFANLESTLSISAPEPTVFTNESTPKINLTVDQYRCLTHHRGLHFDVLQLANNHILDCGQGGITATVKQLRSDNIGFVGVNETEEEAGQPRITESAGIKIGWVAHTFSVNFKPFPVDRPWAVNMTPFHLDPDPDLSAILGAINACRDQGCDLVVVGLHWGLEFELYPHPDQMRWARAFAGAGADIIIGHGPHVPQPVEIYRTKDGLGREVPILYSLGNLSSLLSHPAMALSLVARFHLSVGGVQNERVTRVTGLELVPVVLVGDHINSSSTDIIRLIKLSELSSTKTDPKMRGYIEEIERYADLVIGQGWRC